MIIHSFRNNALKNIQNLILVFFMETKSYARISVTNLRQMALVQLFRSILDQPNLQEYLEQPQCCDKPFHPLFMIVRRGGGEGQISSVNNSLWRYLLFRPEILSQ